MSSSFLAAVEGRAFMRLQLQLQEERMPPPVASRRYRVLVRSPTPEESMPGGELLTLLRTTRVALFTREGYHEATPLAPEALHACFDGSTKEAAGAAFALETTTPTVLNEVRLRAIEWLAAAGTEGGGWERGDEDGGDGGSDYGEDRGSPDECGSAPSHLRLIPPFVVHTSDDGDDWIPLVSHGGFAASPHVPLEARALVLRNAPRRAACRATLSAQLLALPRDVCWREVCVHVHARSEESLAIARVLLEDKVKAFVRRGGDGSVRLKQWPGKDAVQAVAAWWLAARLVEDHDYTEPELYAVIQAECAYPPDLGTIRKELVRRGCLTPPQIRQNDDATTTTSYRLDGGAMRRMLEPEWRARGIC